MRTSDQITDQILSSLSGGTVDIVSGYPLPDHGYYVGGAGETLIFHSQALVNRSMVKAFVGSLTHRFAGWWTDPQTGRVHFDRVSHHTDLDRAVAQAESRGEIAIYDVGAGTDIAIKQPVSPLGTLATILATAGDNIGEHFTCGETDTIAGILTNKGFVSQAADLVRGHAASDDGEYNDHADVRDFREYVEGLASGE